MTKQETVFTEDTKNKTLTVLRHFDAPLDLVWQAWTDATILDQWWAPHPYRAITKKMDFREGGQWLYSMVGPKGDIHWCLVDYTGILPRKSIVSSAAFCDEAGNKNWNYSDWLQEFSNAGNATSVKVVLSFASEEDLKRIVDMGFKEGFTAGLGNLDKYLSKQLKES